MENKSLITPEGELGWNQLFEARPFQDNPDLPKKFSVTVYFTGEEAKKFRAALFEIGKAAKLQDGVLKVNFSRPERMGPPKIIDKNKNELKDLGKFLIKGTKVKVIFSPFEYTGGTALRLEGLMLLEDHKSVSQSKNTTKAVDLSGVSPEFIIEF